jgi:hypothetical protein
MYIYICFLCDTEDGAQGLTQLGKATVNYVPASGDTVLLTCDE